MTDQADPAQPLHQQLPQQLRLLVRLMGEEGAYKLLQRKGGTRYTVPKTLHGRAGMELVELVGAVPAAGLVAEMAGIELTLPQDSRQRRLLRMQRHRQVLDLRRQGQAYPAIAIATGYTERQVINICNRYRVAEPLPPQGELFGPPPTPRPAPSPRDEPGPTAHNPFGLGQRR